MTRLGSLQHSADMDLHLSSLTWCEAGNSKCLPRWHVSNSWNVLFRFKYPLATVDKMFNTFGPNQGGGYDTGCQFGATLANSPLGPWSKQLNYTQLIDAFHSHAHHCLCQLCHLATYQKELGLEDLGVCERAFSCSNALGGIWAPSITSRLSPTTSFTMTTSKHTRTLVNLIYSFLIHHWLALHYSNIVSQQVQRGSENPQQVSTNIRKDYEGHGYWEHGGLWQVARQGEVISWGFEEGTWARDPTNGVLLPTIEVMGEQVSFSSLPHISLLTSFLLELLWLV